MKLVIGITGYPLSGKGTIGEMLEILIAAAGHTVSRHRFSDVLRDTLDLWGLPHGRVNEQIMAQLMDQFGEGTLSRAAQARLAKETDQVGILDGLRWLSDEKMMRQFPAQGIKSMIIYVSASADTRYERLRKRNRAGEEGTTRAEFDRQNLVKTEIYIPEIGSRADAVIENDTDDLAALEAKVKTVYEGKIRPLL